VVRADQVLVVRDHLGGLEASERILSTTLWPRSHRGRSGISPTGHSLVGSSDRSEEKSPESEREMPIVTGAPALGVLAAPPEAPQAASTRPPATATEASPPVLARPPCARSGSRHLLTSSSGPCTVPSSSPASPLRHFPGCSSDYRSPAEPADRPTRVTGSDRSSTQGGLPPHRAPPAAICAAV